MTTENQDSLAKPVSEWSFEFWKQQVEGAIDIPAAVGRLGAAAQISCPVEDAFVFLMEIADCENEKSERSIALAGKARQVMVHILDYKNLWYGEAIRYMKHDVLEKVLYYFRPSISLSGFMNSQSDIKDDEKRLLRLRGAICWNVWQGHVKSATLEEKMQVLNIFYASKNLFSLLPPEAIFKTAQASPEQRWKLFEDVIPHLKMLSEMEVSRSDSWQSVEEAAYFGAPASCILLLVRSILPAADAFYQRHELIRLRQAAAT